jgi:hypothetical protein
MLHVSAMYIKSVPNRNSPPAVLLRESYRDGGKIKKRTIANLSNWPTEIVEGLRTLLKGGKVAAAEQETIVVRRALPHWHVAAVLGTLRDSVSIVCSGLPATAAATSSSR